MKVFTKTNKKLQIKIHLKISTMCFSDNPRVSRVACPLLLAQYLLYGPKDFQQQMKTITSTDTEARRAHKLHVFLNQRKRAPRSGSTGEDILQLWTKTSRFNSRAVRYTLKQNIIGMQRTKWILLRVSRHIPGYLHAINGS